MFLAMLKNPARTKRVSSLQVYTQHPASSSRAYWTPVELSCRICFRNDPVCPDGFAMLTAGLSPDIDFHFPLLWTLVWLTYSELSLSAMSCLGCPLEWMSVASKTSHPHNIWQSCVVNGFVLLPIPTPCPGCSHLLFCTRLFPFSPVLSVHLLLFLCI